MQGKVHAKVDTLNIWWDKVQTNIKTYLIRGKINAVIDTGPPQAAQDAMAMALKSFDLTPADIGLILNTHGHMDHTGGNAVIKAAGHAQLLIHQEDVVFLEDHHLCFDRFFAPLIKAIGREQYLEEERVAFLQAGGPELVVDRRLDDNELIDLGDGIELRVVHLPGHTPGSVGFYWEKEGILFNGDSVSGLNTPGGSLPILYDLAAYRKSVERLMEMPLQCILSCHPYRGLHLPPSTLRRSEEVKQYLHDSREVAMRIAEAVQNQAGRDRALPEITDSVVAGLPAEMGFKRVAELTAPQFSLTTVFFGLAQVQAGQG